jgi:hypothetical protein
VPGGRLVIAAAAVDMFLAAYGSAFCRASTTSTRSVGAQQRFRHSDASYYDMDAALMPFQRRECGIQYL